MHLHPDDAQAIRRKFDRLTNLSQAELKTWIETPESRKVGWVRPDEKISGARRQGERESVGHRSGRRILAIRDTYADDLTPSDYAHMKKVIGFCRRHLAQRPQGDVTDTRWRWSLMNWGHDPLK